MNKIPEIIPLSDLRQEAAGVIKRLQEKDSPVVITQRGRAAAVLISMDGYERLTQNQELLSLLIQGEKEIESGAGQSLEDVMAEAEGLLTDDAD